MNLPSPQPVKRGWPAQRQRREADRAIRRRAIAFDRWARCRGSSRCDVAGHLGVPLSTLAYWQQRWRQDHLAARPRGRSSRRGDVATRNAAIRLMVLVGPRTGLATLRAACPTLARGEVQDLQRRFRRVWRRNHRRLLRVLHWHRPGAVWAMDHVEPPRPVDGHWPHILAVRDLASRMQLAWLPVVSADARETCQALESLFRRYGPPLVLKADNGSAFVSHDTRELLVRWGVFPLFSPPLTPQYNGSCEAAGGAMKTRSEHQAILHDGPGQWTAADLELARTVANHLHRPWGHRQPTSAEVWRHRQPITAEQRAAFGRTVQRHQDQARDELRYPQDTPLSPKAQAQVDRLAIRRACVECGLLTFTRRSFTSPLSAHFAPNIS
jgi:transposase InsO family protein